MRSYIFTEKERRALLRWLEMDEDSSLLRVTLHRLRLSIGSLRRDLELLRLLSWSSLQRVSPCSSR